MAMQDLRGQRDGQCVREDLFNRMGILGCQGDGCRKAMMLFVDQLVEIWNMQQAMAVIKKCFAHKKTQYEIPSKFEGGWQGCFDPVRWL